MSSKTDICNQALGLLGEARISDVDDSTSPAARACNVQFDASRDFLLRRNDWAFARRRVSLSADSETPIGEEYDYQYTIPTGGTVQKALVLRKVVGYKNLTKRDVTREGGKWLMNIAPPITVLYTFQETNTGNFDPAFEQALTYYIAHRGAVPIGKDVQVSSAWLGVFEQFFRTAAGLDAEQDPADPGESFWADVGRGENNREIPLPRELQSNVS